MIKLSVRHAPLAQLDRASDYGSEGQEFESLRAYQKSQTERFDSFALYWQITGMIWFFMKQARRKMRDFAAGLFLLLFDRLWNHSVTIS